MDVVVVLFIAFLVALAFGFFGAWICGEKGRNRNQGLAIGFLFGPLGCLILALLPVKEKEGPAPRKPKPRWNAETADFRVESFGRPKSNKDEEDAARYLNVAAGPKLTVLSWTKDGAARCKCSCGYPMQVPRGQLGKTVICETCQSRVIAPKPR